MLSSFIKNIVSEPRFKQLTWLIEYFEGFGSQLYQDSGGYSTIGYGHKIIGSLNQDEGLKYLNLSLSEIEKGLSLELASQLLAYDIFNCANISNDIITEISDPIWIALTSFCFNIGSCNFKKSDALKYLPSSNLCQVADSLSSWRECNKVFSKGIAKRRFIEVLILLQKPIDLMSSLLPSQQWHASCKMPFTDENWIRLPSQLKQEIAEVYTIYIKNIKMIK